MLPDLRWNIDYNISALVLLLIVVSSFFARKNLPLRLNRIYRNLLLLSLGSVLFDTMTVFLISWHQLFPQSLITAVNLIYLLCVNAIPPVFLLYVHEVTGIPRHRHGIRHAWWFLPVVISAVSLLITPWTGFVFTYDSSGMYGWGPGMLFLYGVSEYFILISLAYTIRYRRVIGWSHFAVMLFFIVAGVVAVFIQILLKNQLVVGFTSAVSMLLLYMSLQSPDQGTDLPTGVFNRSAFLTMLNIRLSRKVPFVVLALAIDDFKFINNTFGIVNGDALIRMLAHWLRALSPDKQVYRIGGDQFALFYSGTVSEAQSLLETLQDRLEHPWSINTVSVTLSACTVVLSYPEDARSVEDVVDGIDFSIHAGKKQRKGATVFTRDLSVKPGMRAVAVEKAVRRAIRNDSFAVFFQPIYSIKKKCFCSVEALIRLKDEELGVIPPDEFIPLAEKNGLILEIGSQIFTKVCRQVMALDLPGLGIEFVEINLSAVQCMQQDLAAALLSIMRQTGIDPSIVNLEVTETTAVNSPEALARSMTALIKEGVSFSLDDYGSGYSTIDYITSYNFRLVKIDKSIVWSFLDNPKASIVLTHTINMLKDLDMHIVAEGVETLEQSDALSAMGCDYLQGYYYSRPLSCEDIVPFLKNPSLSV